MRIIASIFIAGAAAISVFAQTAGGNWTLGPNWVYNRNISNLEIARIAMQGEINKRLLVGKPSSGKNKKKIIATGPAAYKKGSGYLVPELVVNQSDGSVAEKAELKKALEQSLKFYENIAFLKEYPDNDLSFAMLYYVINNYVIYRNISPSATDVSGQTQFLVGGFYTPLLRDEQAFYLQIQRQLVSNKEVTAMKNEDKQKAVELLAIYTTLIWHQFQEFKEKRDMNGLGLIRSQAISNVEAFAGAPIAQVDIGNNGLVVLK